MVGPFSGADILTIPAYTLAKDVATCPDSPLAISCPLLARFINQVRMGKVQLSHLSGTLCPNHCAEHRGQQILEIKHATSLPKLDSGSFTIVGMAHPLTHVAAAKTDEAVTADKAREDVESRGEGVKALVDAYISQDQVGNDYSALLAKDSIHVPIYRRNSTWFIWESFAGDRDHHQQDLEWDLDSNALEMIGVESLDFDDEGKSDLSVVLKTAKKRVLAQNPDQDVQGCT